MVQLQFTCIVDKRITTMIITLDVQPECVLSDSIAESCPYISACHIYKIVVSTYPVQDRAAR